MANRYWVGGTASWDGTAGSKWSLTSGGAGGEAVPTSSDDVFFDAASGAVTVTVAAGNTGCLSLSFTGFTGSFAGSAGLAIAGSMTIDAASAAAMTWSASGTLTFTTSSIASITTNGKSITSQITQNGTGVLTFADSITTTGSITQTKGTLTAAGDVTALVFYSLFSANVRVINMGSGTWTLTFTSPAVSLWALEAANLTLNPGTSTIKITNTGFFQSPGLTYNNFWITGSNTSPVVIQGANTFNNFRDDRTVAHTIVFPNSTTTVSSWDVNGSSGNVITLSRTGASGQWTISDASGTNTSSYLSISNSTATGGATWDVSDGTNTDGGGNTGWSFTPPPPPAQTVQQAARDANFVTTLLVTNKIDGQAPMRAYVDPSTHSLVVSDASTGTDYSDDIASRDNNYVPVLMGVSSVDGVTPVAVYGDASTGAVLVDSN